MNDPRRFMAGMVVLITLGALAMQERQDVVRPVSQSTFQRSVAAAAPSMGADDRAKWAAMLGQWADCVERDGEQEVPAVSDAADLSEMLAEAVRHRVDAAGKADPWPGDFDSLRRTIQDEVRRRVGDKPDVTQEMRRSYAEVLREAAEAIR